ncbi:hypothetical protein HDV05_005621, partial [Chytridiales sp. JEL 0842]
MPETSDTQLSPILGLPQLHTKELKIRKVKGNEDIVAGSAGVPVNVFVVDCQPKECSVTPIVNEHGELVEFNME